MEIASEVKHEEKVISPEVKPEEVEIVQKVESKKEEIAQKIELKKEVIKPKVEPEKVKIQPRPIDLYQPEVPFHVTTKNIKEDSGNEPNEKTRRITY